MQLSMELNMLETHDFIIPKEWINEIELRHTIDIQRDMILSKMLSSIWKLSTMYNYDSTHLEEKPHCDWMCDNFNIAELFYHTTFPLEEVDR